MGFTYNVQPQLYSKERLKNYHGTLFPEHWQEAFHATATLEELSYISDVEE